MKEVATPFRRRYWWASRDGAFDGSQGSTTREVFEAYVEHFLAPELRPGQAVVLNKLEAHKGEGSGS